MPLPGDPDALLDAAEQLARAAQRLADLPQALAAHAHAVDPTWSGAAAPLAAARLSEHPASVRKAADAASRAVAPLRAFAEELRSAQQDHALGEQMVSDGEAAYAAAGSAAAVGADAAREAAAQVVTDGSNAIRDAEDRMRLASEQAAGRVRAATALLAGVAPAEPPAPVVGGEQGTVADGVRKALTDVGTEAATTATGLAAHVNPFSDDFGPSWSNTWNTITTALAHPVDAASTMVSGTVAPLGDSYRSGGVDEAIGRAPGVIAGIVGFKGLTKLEKLRLLRGEDSSLLTPGGGLQRHEDAGGHTLRPDKAHVGATPSDMIHRLRNDAMHLTGVSSYFDRASAERSVAENLKANDGAVADWLRGSKTTKAFVFKHDHTVGHHLDGNATSPDEAVDVSGSRVVLRRDPSMPDGYLVLTSYPIP